MFYITSVTDIEKYKSRIPDDILENLYFDVDHIDSNYGTVEDGRDPFNDDGGVCLILEKSDDLEDEINLKINGVGLDMQYDDIFNMSYEAEFVDKLKNGWKQMVIICNNDYGVSVYFYDPKDVV